MKQCFENLCCFGKSKSQKNLDDLRKTVGESDVEEKSPKTEAEEREEDWIKNYENHIYSTNKIMGNFFETKNNTSSPPLPRKSLVTKEQSEIFEDSFKGSCEILRIPEYGLGESNLSYEGFTDISIEEEDLKETIKNCSPSVLRTKSEGEEQFKNHAEYVNNRRTASDFDSVEAHYGEDSDIEDKYDNPQSYETPRRLESDIMHVLDVQDIFKSSDN